MSELLVDFITSLDGYVSGDGWPGFWGLEGPEYLAWLGEQPEVTYLMGANTYRLMSGFAAGEVPAGQDEFRPEEEESVDGLTKASKVVFSSTLDAPLTWANSTLVRDDAVEAVRAMKESETGLISTIGSLSLCRSLLQAGIVDRFRVVMFPVITGATGDERIYDGYPDVALEMTEHRTFDESIQLVEYRPRGARTPAARHLDVTFRPPVDVSTARRLFELVEPVAVVTYMANEPTEAVMALGAGNVWDAYFAGRAAPLGRDVPPEVVHALFYNFADGEVARHIPGVWERVTPEAANAARTQGSVAALRRILGDLADGPGVARAGELLIRAGLGAPTEGRALYAAVRTLPLPTEPLTRCWHGANLLREHRGDGHVAALVTLGVGGTECHVLHALSEGMPADQFGRVSHLPRAQVAAVVDAMRARRLIGADGWLTAAGRRAKERIETLTDELAAPAYDVLEPGELDRLIEDLEPLAAVLVAAGSQ